MQVFSKTMHLFNTKFCVEKVESFCQVLTVKPKVIASLRSAASKSNNNSAENRALDFIAEIENGVYDEKLGSMDFEEITKQA